MLLPKAAEMWTLSLSAPLPPSRWSCTEKIHTLTEPVLLRMSGRMQREEVSFSGLLVNLSWGAIFTAAALNPWGIPAL